MPEFSVVVWPGSPHGVFIDGEIDLVTASEVTEALTGLTGDLRVDCSHVTFIDTAGFYALDGGYLAAKIRGDAFRVTGLGDFSTRVARILDVQYVSW